MRTDMKITSTILLVSQLLINITDIDKTAIPGEQARGGRVITDHEKQWLGSVHWQKLKCSVSLIHPSFVLTAQHCNAVPESIVKFDHIQQVRTVVKVYKLCPRRKCDIMVLKLDRPIDCVTPIEISTWKGMDTESKGILHSMGSPDFKRTMLLFESADTNSDWICDDKYPGANKKMQTDKGCICPKDSGGAFTVKENGKEIQVGLLCHLCKKPDGTPNCERGCDTNPDPGKIDDCSTTGRFQPFEKEHVDKIKDFINKNISKNEKTASSECNKS